EPSDILVMSAGGNDALGSISLLSDPQPYTISQVLAHLYTVKESFRTAYAATLDALVSYQCPAFVCTVSTTRTSTRSCCSTTSPTRSSQSNEGDARIAEAIVSAVTRTAPRP